MPPLRHLLSDAVSLLSPGFRAAHAALWANEHLDRIADRLADWHANGVPAEPPAPRFAAEIPPAFGEAFAPFRDVLADPSPPRLAAVLERAGCASLLLLLGQRRTPASLTDARGIPPTVATLTASASARHQLNDAQTVAARALAKHAHRSPDRFWGDVTGPSERRNAAAADVLARILAGRTWWNVFGHFAHDTVFEARLPTGHGARWGAAGATFVGFLEPFDESKCPSLADTEE